MAIDTDSIISELINVVKSCAIENVAYKGNNSQQPWFDNECEHLKQEKVNLLHKFRKNSSNNDLGKYNTSRISVLQEKRKLNLTLIN